MEIGDQLNEGTHRGADPLNQTTHLKHKTTNFYRRDLWVVWITPYFGAFICEKGRQLCLHARSLHRRFLLCRRRWPFANRCRSGADSRWSWGSRSWRVHGVVWLIQYMLLQEQIKDIIIIVQSVRTGLTALRLRHSSSGFNNSWTFALQRSARRWT